jgi:hypothetical protein
MPGRPKAGTRTVKAVHGLRKVERDPEFELGLSDFLSRDDNQAALLDMYQRFAGGRLAPPPTPSRQLRELRSRDSSRGGCSHIHCLFRRHSRAGVSARYSHFRSIPVIAQRFPVW